MITVYRKKYIPKEMEQVVLNDIFFNKHTADNLDSKAATIISEIDNSELISNFTIKSRFDSNVLNVDALSTGCKTALNIMYNPNKAFDIRECGDNALDVIYSLSQGNVFCDYPYISFDMNGVYIFDKHGKREIDTYEELKEWWTNEN